MTTSYSDHLASSTNRADSCSERPSQSTKDGEYYDISDEPNMFEDIQDYAHDGVIFDCSKKLAFQKDEKYATVFDDLHNEMTCGNYNRQSVLKIRSNFEPAFEHIDATLEPIDLSDHHSSNSNNHSDKHATKNCNVNKEEEYYSAISYVKNGSSLGKIINALQYIKKKKGNIGKKL